ncbi:L,D-transpeptidase [Paracoccus tibetensis]|uniref:L,D-transpeptidase catalytic domain n=1 Tax=Paracoccus tibetensis TaxID=336292 RepID=A0A1G5G3Z3_9RHOB|nr:L,D-transpeptidase [Paracoccus tibetensis]SCY46222.1 L,D-transpeptidase catalytic domain [Paracoccus tibetensis]
MSTHRFADRRSFLRGLAATGVLLPAAAYGQAATDTGPERNQSSFRTRHWRDFYPTLGKGVLLADVTSRAVHYWSGDESVHFVFPCAIPMTEDLTRRGQTEIVRKMPNPPWTPTPSMREKDPTLPQTVAGGAPENPLGKFGLYLAWPAYLVHGTHDTRKIGRRSSSGCYGLYNEHVEQLYAVAEIGTQVTVF